MTSLRLFDRMQSLHHDGKTQARNGEKAAVDSVVGHLKRLLNVRQGSTLMDPFYGMPDFSDLRAEVPDSVTEIEDLIARVITTYEPRLGHVDVQYMHRDEQQILYFQIKGVLETGKAPLPVFLESIVDPCGKMVIKE